MGYRTVLDGDGVEWQVWEVRPVWAERRTTDRRSADSSGVAPGAERRTSGDRRAGFDPSRPRVSPGLEDGWLAFASDRERRRLAPPPAAWDALPDEALLELCRRASPCQPRADRSSR